MLQSLQWPLAGPSAPRRPPKSTRVMVACVGRTWYARRKQGVLACTAAPFGRGSAPAPNQARCTRSPPVRARNGAVKYVCVCSGGRNATTRACSAHAETNDVTATPTRRGCTSGDAAAHGLIVVCAPPVPRRLLSGPPANAPPAASPPTRAERRPMNQWPGPWSSWPPPSGAPSLDAPPSQSCSTGNGRHACA